VWVSVVEAELPADTLLILLVVAAGAVAVVKSPMAETPRVSRLKASVWHR
jgi:hypothetical protein